MRVHAFLSVFSALALGLAAAAHAAPGKLPAPYTIVATCGMVTDIAREVAGERARTIGLMGEGVDPHLYKPTRDDVARLLRADVVFYSGLLLEGRMTDTLRRLGSKGTPVFAVAESLDKAYLLATPGLEGHVDPHVWMDVKGWIAAVRAVERSLSGVDPANAAEYGRNAARYTAELERLDDYARRAMATVPKERRVLVTAHDAFHYFGRAYDVEVRGVQGVNTESEAGVADINRLVDFLVSRRIPALFVESSVSDKNVKALIEGAAARGHTVRIGGRLFSDAMGRPGAYEGTYIGMIDHNVTTIAQALGGQAPERGLNGRLAGTGGPK